MITRMTEAELYAAARGLITGLASADLSVGVIASVLTAAIRLMLSGEDVDVQQRATAMIIAWLREPLPPALATIPVAGRA